MKKTLQLLALLLGFVGLGSVAYLAISQLSFQGASGVALAIFICLFLSAMFGFFLLLLSRIIRSSHNDTISMNQLPGHRRFAGDDISLRNESQSSPVVQLRGQQTREGPPQTPYGQSEHEPQHEGPISRSSQQNPTNPGSADLRERGSEPPPPVSERVAVQSNPQASGQALRQASTSFQGHQQHRIGGQGKGTAETGDKKQTQGGEPFSAQNARALLMSRLVEIEELAQQTKQKISAVDSRMMKHLPKNTAGSIQGVVNVRRIISALEKRAGEITEIIQDSELSDLERARYLYEGELIIEEDSLNTLIDSKPLEPIKPEELRPVLVELFQRISRRKTIFKGMNLDFIRKNKSK